MDYSQKNVFVAGGSSGINLAIADALASAGARVAILGRQQAKIDAALAQLRRHGGDVRGFAADVRDAAAVQQAVEQTAQDFGPLDVVISGAAGNFISPAAELSPNGFKSVMDIDVLGTFHVMLAVWPHLRKPGAAILNLTAAQSWMATPGQIHVCAAKSGVDQIMRTLAIEWGPSGVRVNSIAPGPVADTEGMARLAPTPAAARAWTRAVPLGRFASKDDIVRAALWLCSSAADYVTGVVLSVDGGLSLGGSSAVVGAMAS
ncbi:SDR family oxidoreductase [Paraburkholderia ferrariae]|uniref:SDR family oxidoreductase n=1 Tax=Paraburkholderia ferrariae TaxID=386056 RepID=UPI000487DD31|nr:SDR family oxidoreductase [Paraburkholderia ferrariae]